MPDEYALRLRRGALAGLPATLAQGELVSTTDQVRLIVGGGGSVQHVVALKHNPGGTAAPAVGDDAGDGYSPGSLWVWPAAGRAWVCTDSTAGAAVWLEVVSTAVLTAAVNALAWKQPARMATTGNVTLSGLQTIDGVSGADGDRILVRAQSTGSENGLYVMGSGSWARAADAATGSALASAVVAVGEGATLANKVYQQTADNVTLGTTAVVWAELGGGGGSGTVTSVNLTAPAAGITVSGGPITSSGSITLALTNDLKALEDLTVTDAIVYRAAADTWSAVTIGAGLTFSGGTLSGPLDGLAGGTYPIA